MNSHILSASPSVKVPKERPHCFCVLTKVHRDSGRETPPSHPPVVVFTETLEATVCPDLNLGWFASCTWCTFLPIGAEKRGGETGTYEVYNTKKCFLNVLFVLSVKI